MLIDNYCCYLVTKSCHLLCNPMECSPPGPLSMEFSRQGYWSGWPFPSPGDLPDPVIKCKLLALTGGFFATEPAGKPNNC